MPSLHQHLLAPWQDLSLASVVTPVLAFVDTTLRTRTSMAASFNMSVSAAGVLLTVKAWTIVTAHVDVGIGGILLIRLVFVATRTRIRNEAFMYTMLTHALAFTLDAVLDARVIGTPTPGTWLNFIVNMRPPVTKQCLPL